MADTADLMALQYMNSLPDSRRGEFHMSFLSRKKNRTTALLLALFLGGFGVDRFYLGQTGLGIAKLLTLGACGVWTLVDWFLIMGAADRVNMATLNELRAVYPPMLAPQQYAYGQLPAPGQAHQGPAAY